MNEIDTIITHLRRSKRVAVLTGAGVSEESGIPTFRDPQTGLWAQYDPMVLATAQAFAENPKLVWDWYEWRRKVRAKAKPNAGHFALAELEIALPHFALITQNIDNLHRVAGSRNMIELHGNIHRNKCARENIVVEPADARPAENGMLACPHCGAYLRPDVVWFGEALPRAELERAFQEAQACDLFFSIGTSAVVEPAASLPRLAKQCGAVLVEINPRETAISAFADVVARGKSGQVLPGIVARLREGQIENRKS